eukprot:TRINITY_DN7169_c0_g1_i1.p1 TRINITY_DN7169_c0_g1~~TRINITY_DN7169_c0_g1_i1.p1  ORF type:complete len:761 (-),score=270.56 TRINITY_DN7169_c0_g1_i1:47-2329(-)
MMETKERPAWFAPPEASADEPSKGVYQGLKVYNSLTCTKVKFVPNEGRKISWYICGPTVYDSSHMGHARNYVTFDIIRRILEDYFNYQVYAVMNVTDVDDKIILKARQSHLFNKYAAAHVQLDATLLADVKEAWPLHIAAIQRKIDALHADKKRKDDEKAPEVRLLQERLAEATAAAQQAAAVAADPSQSSAALLELSRSALCGLLDAREGATVNDPAIFRETAAFYEKEFLEDMGRLGVRMPDVLTRVSEYIPQIVDYVKTIQDNGFAYATDSVYFDTVAFKAKGFRYGKLEPWSVGNERLIEEGEGGLSDGRQKKNGNDFALWKAYKPGEPKWPSPWGDGRPGWHIECSAMVHAHLPGTLDVHLGGEDLRFPHHDNEIAQAEAFYGCKQWTNYFLHAGHLHIDGLKMSKSLKNFITIRQALDKHTPRQLRLLFLLKPWDKTMNYAEAAMDDIRAKEKKLSEFFLCVQNVVRDLNVSEQVQSWTEVDAELHAQLQLAQDTVDTCLKDSFDTVGAMHALLDLVSQTNIYFSKTKQRRAYLVSRVGSFVTRMLKIFGVIEADSVGWQAPSGGAQSADEQLTPALLNALAAFRNEVRTAARDKKLEPAAMLALCDRLRDDVMPPLGVRLEDEGGFPWKLVNADELMRELEAKRANERKIQRQKLETKVKALAADLQKLAVAKLPPASVFPKDAYSQFDKGIPTHDAQGAELSKNARKAVVKTFELQEKKHTQYLKELEKDPEFEAKLERDLRELTEKLKNME